MERVQAAECPSYADPRSGFGLNAEMDSHSPESAAMDATTVAIDLAKDVFELAFADTHGRCITITIMASGTTPKRATPITIPTFEVA
jgi:hypothetical protein